MEIMSKNELSSVEWLEQELKKIPFVNVLEVFEQAKAMQYAKRFNIWTEQIDKSNKEGYFIYDGIIFFGNRFGVFFVSNQNEWK